MVAMLPRRPDQQQPADSPARLLSGRNVRGDSAFVTWERRENRTGGSSLVC